MAVSTLDGDIATKQALDLTGSENVSISDNDRYAFEIKNDFTFEGWVSQDTFTQTYAEAPYVGSASGNNHLYQVTSFN